MVDRGGRRGQGGGGAGPPAVGADVVLGLAHLGHVQAHAQEVEPLLTAAVALHPVHGVACNENRVVREGLIVSIGTMKKKGCI